MKNILGMVAVLLFFLTPLPAFAASDEGHEHHVAAEQLGKVSFPTSCSKSAQQDFEHGVAWIHSFGYADAQKAFANAAEKDPNCAMAYWGIAMSYYHQLWEPTLGDYLKQGARAAQKSTSLAEKATPREQSYINAIAIFYRDSDKLDHLTRAQAYSAAMEQVYLRNPQDREAAVFYALSLLGITSPNDKTYANPKKAGAILEKVFVEQPLHPGVAHYIIHAYDYPPLASLGLDAARRYAAIAPSAPHALHMPSHIFTRVGMWQDAIASNRAAEQAALQYAAEAHMDGAWEQQLHAMDYLMYAYLQSGQESDAKQVANELGKIHKAQTATLSSEYAFAAIPARYAVEGRRWNQAAALQPRSSKYLGADAILYFARALGAAHVSKLAAAQSNIEKLESLRKELLKANDNYWADQIEIQRREAAGWLAYASGKNQEAVQLLRSAAELEDTTDKINVTPGSIVPAHELLGDLLMELKQPAEALEQYEISLKNTPNRFHGLYGAGRSAELAGDSIKARFYYSKLLASASHGDPDLAALRDARLYLSKQQTASKFDLQR